jgi:hypothetical protein
MRIVAAMALIASVLCFAVQADVAVTGVAAVEVTKKCHDATAGNLDASWVRAEVKLAGSLKNSGLTGLLHLRLQPDVGSKASDNKFNFQARQIYFKMPVSILNILAGRWYEIYGPGYYYFGRYLVETKRTGSGSMNTDYTILDGLKLTLNINPIRCALNVAFLPRDLNFEDAYVMAMFGGSPVEQLKFNIGGNFEAITPDGKDAVHRFMVNCGYTFLKDLGLGLFGEMAIVNLSEAADNMWFLAGFTTKALPVLDKIQLELEIKNHRAGDPTTDNNLAWMLLLQRKVLGLTLDLNVGADPTILGSKKIGDVGAVFRATAVF